MESHKSARYEQILSSMQERSTEELLEIWHANDRESWSEEAFEAIRQVLEQRLGKVPEQGETPEIGGEVEEGEDEQVEDTYHSPTRIIKLVTWADTLSWVVLVIYGLNFLRYLSTSIWPKLSGYEGDWFYIASMLLSSLDSLITGFFIFLVLRFASEISCALLDIYEEVGPAEPASEA
jgi:hypothetical protein